MRTTRSAQRPETVGERSDITGPASGSGTLPGEICTEKSSVVDRFTESPVWLGNMRRLLSFLGFLCLVQVGFAAVLMDTAQQTQNVFNIDAATSAVTTTDGVPPTAKQFQSVLSSGRSFFPVAPAPEIKAVNTNGVDTDDNLASKVVTPANTIGSIKMPFARIGASYVQRPTLFLLGSVITPPDQDEGGNNLSVESNEYWFDEPYVPEGTEHPDEYYWSPHAGNVFAVRSGAIGVSWRKRDPIRDSQDDVITTAPSGDQDVDWAEIGGGLFYAFPTDVSRGKQSCENGSNNLLEHRALCGADR